jgi:hypothetical protein
VLGKLSFVAGFAAGYVVGTRAGRDRYEQIAALAQRAASSPAARSARESLAAQADGVMDSARRSAQDAFSSGGADPEPGGRPASAPYPGAAGTRR